MTPPRGAAVFLLACLAASSQPAAAQRRYLVEAGAAGSAMSFDASTDLNTGPGGLIRLGFWLPFRLSIEGEGSLVKPKTSTASIGVDVKQLSIATLYNVIAGANNSVYLKAGIGSTTYGGSCPAVAIPGSGPCGTAGTFIGGLGFRIGIVPTVMVRGEGVINRNISGDLKFSNYGGNLGLSIMLGSKKTTDSDGDGVLDSDDKCPGTPHGAVVDKKGCPIDTDGDGVYDGLDQCPNTPHGAKVDSVGCPIDSDNDGVPDGIDQCPDTPVGAKVDAMGCPIDSDGDGVPDGIDRCPNTPRGATVDALGCPSDSDGDGVLDGLDKCPNTPPGTPVDANGCPAGQGPPAPKPKPTPSAAPPPTPPPQRAPPPAANQAAPSPAEVKTEPHPDAARVSKFVLRDNAFAFGSARLRPSASATLDSVAAALAADPSLRFEVGAHTAPSRSEVDSRGFASLRIEAVRSYLIAKGVRPQRLAPKVYGATQLLTADTTATGRSINRRIEIVPLPAGP
ncbi:MAG TPA: thrombospondin type 3 repeat-containing protein [Gemmatimonadales bacterium]|nr:thrombospondin type 3 repeat-containing protein [Gemmatimonadales bacterium]